MCRAPPPSARRGTPTWSSRATTTPFTKKSWAGPLAAGTSFSFGFIGAPGGLAAVQNCKLNGAACTGGPVNPSPSPTPRSPPAVPHADPLAGAHGHPDGHSPAGRQEGHRLLHQLGRLRPPVLREEPAHQRLRRQADPHPVRLRQRPERPVHDLRQLRRLRHGLHRGQLGRRRRRHVGPAAARQLQPAPQAQGDVPGPEGHLQHRRLDLLRRLHPGRREPGRVRQLLLQHGRGPALGRRLRRHRHRLGVPERLRPHL